MISSDEKACLFLGQSLQTNFQWQSKVVTRLQLQGLVIGLKISRFFHERKGILKIDQSVKMP